MAIKNVNQEVENFISAMEEALPPVFARNRLTELSGGLINSRTITNKMSLGEGPPGVKVGGRVGFSRASFIEWLRDNKAKASTV